MSGNVLGAAYPELEARAPVYQAAQQNNLLQSYGQAVDIKNALLQGQVLQGQPAIQQQQLSNMQTEQQGQQQDQAIKRVQSNLDLLTPFVPLIGKGVVTPESAKAQLDYGVKLGTLTPQLAQTLDSQMPATAGPEMDNWLQSHYALNTQALQNLTGVPTSVNTGGVQTFQRVNPFNNTVTPMQGGTFQNTTSPEWNNSVSPLALPGPNNQPVYKSNAQQANAMNGGGAGGGFGSSGGRYPTPGEQSLPGGGVTTTLTPDRQHQIMASPAQFDAITTDAQGLPQKRAILDNMVQSLSGTTTGPSPITPVIRNLVASANQTFGTNVSADSINNAQEFAKYANQWSIAAMGSMGGGTDAKLDAAMHANPNPSLNTSVNTQIGHVLQGNLDYAQALQGYAQRTRSTPGATYGDFTATVNNNTDPRVFQMMRMNPDEQQALWKSLDGPKAKGQQYSPAQTDFMNKYAWMAQNGLIAPSAPPQQQAAAAPSPQPTSAPSGPPQVPTTP